MPGLPRAKHWCFTLNVPDELASREPCWDPVSMRYLIYQLERAPTTGQLHYQGYVCLARAGRISDVKLWLGSNSVHLEQCRDVGASIEYCRKADSSLYGPEGVVQRGSVASCLVGQGRRSDMADVADLCRSGGRETDVLEQFPAQYLRYHGGIRRAIQIASPGRDGSVPCMVSIYYGPTGTGKTRRAYRLYPSLYAKPAGTKWWDGYAGETVVLIDDFNGKGQEHITYWLRVCDRYPLQVETKGGYVALAATHIIFTSNQHPDLWWYDNTDSEHRLAFLRRVTEIKEIHMVDLSLAPSDDEEVLVESD